MKTILSFLLLTLAVFGFSCGGSSNNAITNSKNAEVKKGVTPVADPDVAVIEMENPAFGTIKMELYSNIAPKMVERFKELAKNGYYEGIIFHRVNQSVIQAGDANTKQGRPTGQAPPMKEGDSGLPNVVAEFSDVPYDTAIVGAARLGNDVNSQNSQFFITLKREKGFDNSYTVFGKVIEGMNNVRTIAGAPKEGERPTEPIRIKKVTIVPRG